MMSVQPKVSVIIPSLNVGKYVSECLESVIHQTLKEIEIICVDAGSTDGTAEILRNYEAQDNRIRVITSDIKSYGYQMNLGISMAKGEFVAFLESDDFIAGNAYEILYQNAQTNNVDIIKANYVEVWGQEGAYTLKTKTILQQQSQYYTIFDPTVNPWLFYVPMMNCLGLFKREFLEEYHIRHNETPGASHQDMGFWFQTFCLAKRIYFIKDTLYHYRQDNPNSSINDHRKVYCVRDEYRFMWDFLLRNPDILAWCAPIYYHRMFGSFWFTYNKLNHTLKPLFLYEVLRNEFLTAQSRENFDISRFSPNERKLLNQIIETPDLLLERQFDREGTIAELSDKLAVLQSKLNQYQVRFNQLQDTKSVATSHNTSDILVSVIIPVYNTEKYINECINSITAQSLPHIEIICIDDGSTDHSLQILQKISQQDGRVKVLSQDNMGQSAARNRGLELAHGKYIYFMDSDDRLKSNALEFLVNEAEKNRLDILYFDGTVFFDNDELKKKYLYMQENYVRPFEYSQTYSGIKLLSLMHHDNVYRVSPCLQLISRSHLSKYHITFYEGIIYEDNLFNLRCMLSAERVSHRKQPFFERRIRSDSTTTQKREFKHLYGYLVCYVQMRKLQIEYMWNNDAISEITLELNQISRTIKRYYNELSQEQLKMMGQLNNVELSFLKDILGATEKNYQSAQLPNNLASLELQLKKAQQEIIDIRNSYTYRIGRVITFIPRNLRKSVRCYRENGLKYTVRKVITYLSGNGVDK